MLKQKILLEKLVQGNASWFEAQKDMQKDIEAMKI